MTTRDRVKKIASSGRILTADGELKQLDSLALIDLIVALEREFALSIPPAELKRENFASLSALAEMIDGAQARSAGKRSSNA